MTHDQIRDKELGKSPEALALFNKVTGDHYRFKNTATWGAFKKGWSACQNGKSKKLCPYHEPENVCTFRRGYLRFWMLGYDYRLWKVRPDIWPKPIQARSKTKRKPNQELKPTLVTRKLRP